MRRFAWFTLSLPLLVLIAACVPPPPPGQPQRYRDEAFPNVTKQIDIVYGQAPDEFGQPETLKLDLYQPAGDTATSRAVVVWVHGGGFHQGDKADNRHVAFATGFAKRGYVSASINYRLRDDNQVLAAMDAQHDAQAAVRWFPRERGGAWRRPVTDRDRRKLRGRRHRSARELSRRRPRRQR